MKSSTHTPTHQQPNRAQADNPTAMQLHQYLGEEQAAAYLNVSRSWLRQLRQKGGGPVYYKCSRRVLYSIEDLDSWVHARRVVR